MELYYCERCGLVYCLDAGGHGAARGARIRLLHGECMGDLVPLKLAAVGANLRLPGEPQLPVKVVD